MFETKRFSKFVAAVMAVCLGLCGAGTAAVAAPARCPQGDCDMDCEVIRTNATCSAAGSLVYKCPVHGEMEISAIPASHTYLDIEGTYVAPTCTQPGTMDMRCVDCGDEMTEELYDPLGHDLEWVEALAPSDTAAGNTAHWKCARCAKLFSDADGKTEVREEDVAVPAHTHTLELRPAKEPTEDRPGNTKFYTCTGCGRHFADAAAVTEVSLEDVVLKRLDHALVFVPAKEATETKEGNTKHYLCQQGCGRVFADPDGADEVKLEDTIIPPLGHLLVRVPAKEPTEDQDGRIQHWKCSRTCGKLFRDADARIELSAKDTIVPALGHILERIPGTDPTEDEPGVREHWRCRECGRLFADSDGNEVLESTKIPAFGHALEAVPAKEPTEEEDGNLAHWRCTRCGRLFADAAGTKEISREDTLVPRTEHRHVLLEVPETAPTDERDGVRQHWQCSKCGRLFADAHGTQELESVVLEALGHDLEQVKEVKPTEETPGVKEHWRCRRCGKLFADGEATEVLDPSQVILEPLSHVHDMEEIASIQPTETQPGTVHHWRCRGCGKLFADSEGTSELTERQILLPALGHDLMQVAGREPTDEEAGVRAHWKCRTCGSLFFDAGGHLELSDPSVDPLGHDLIAHPGKEAEPDQEGSIAYWECRRCGKLFADPDGKRQIALQDTILPATHAHTWNEQSQDPSCTEPGWTKDVCADCGQERDREERDALGHDLEAVPATEPTQTQAGTIAHWRCRLCDGLFADSDAKVLLTDEDIVLQALPTNAPSPTPAPPVSASGTMTEVPKTDDTENLAMYIWLCAGSTAVIVLAVVSLRRRRGRTREEQ